MELRVEPLVFGVGGHATINTYPGASISHHVVIYLGGPSVLQLLLLRVLAVIWQQNTLSRELFDTRRTLTLGLMGPPSTKGRSRR